jgi:hypothetical protein
MNNKSESVWLKLTGGVGGAIPLIIADEEFQVDFQCTFR